MIFPFPTFPSFTWQHALMLCLLDRLGDGCNNAYRAMKTSAWWNEGRGLTYFSKLNDFSSYFFRSLSWLEMLQKILRWNVLHRGICSWLFEEMRNWIPWSRRPLLEEVSSLISTNPSSARKEQSSLLKRPGFPHSLFYHFVYFFIPWCSFNTCFETFVMILFITTLMSNVHVFFQL